MVVVQPENTNIYSVLNQQAYNDFQNETTHLEKNASNLP